MPLFIERPGTPFATLRFVGSGISDYSDGLVRQGSEVQAADAFSRMLRELGGWRLADLEAVRPEAVVRHLAARWDGSKRTLHQVNCPMMEVRPWDETVAGVSRNLRKTAKKAVSRTKQAGVEAKLVPGGEEAARRWVALHRESWSGKEIIAEHTTDRFESCMVDAVRRMDEAGIAKLSEFSKDGEAFGSHLLVFGRDFVGEYLYGTTTEALAQYQMSSLYIKDLLEVAQDRGAGKVSLLRGEEPYKMRWPVEPVPNHRILLSKNRAAFSAYSSYLDLRSWYSANTPEKVKEIVNRFRKD